jgi:hypothetical protein
VDFSQAAELQTTLEGVSLPAEKNELLSYAASQRARPVELQALRSLPDRLYQSLDEVGEALVRVQPTAQHEVPHEPKEESGAPPGGSAYVELHPESGATRDLVADS